MTYYIQSLPPKDGMFVHHSYFAQLKTIFKHGQLVSGWKPASYGKPLPTISLTTDPGRFLSPLGMVGISLGAQVDGFVEFSAQPLLDENLVVPCLYESTDEALIETVQKTHTIFTIENLPVEYKFILRFVVHRDIFLSENEWVHLGMCLNIADYKVYIAAKQYKRFVNAISDYGAGGNAVFKLTDHPKLNGV